MLNRTIQFNFGNLHNQRVDEWYRRVLPRHQVAAWCRTYELALAMVQAGLGVALVPQLCTQLGGQAVYDVDLYAVPEHGAADRGADPAAISPRPAVRGVPGMPKRAAAELDLPPVGPAPPFLGRRHARGSTAEA